MDAHRLLCSLGFVTASLQGLESRLEYPHVVTSGQVPVELNRDASFKELRALLGRWMDAEANNVSMFKNNV